MTADRDVTPELAERVAAAAGGGTGLRIRGGGSKDFYGRQPAGETLDVSAHRGIVNHEPTELVLTARAGTHLAELEAALHEQGQMMPFEPPDFGGGATLGGTIACGLSGPRRPWAGAARDFVLGTRVINGSGEVLRFGGEVMKNVAGYDVSRLVTGSLGTLGVILEVSMKVLPRPRGESTRILELDPAAAFARVEEAYRAGLPVAGAVHDSQRLHLRLAGAAQAVDAGIEALGGEAPADAETFWRALRDHQLPFFRNDGPPLWRISLPPRATLSALPGERLLDWNGQLVWLRTEAPPTRVFAAASEAGGHATLFRGGDRGGDVFQPLATPVRRLHERIRNAFDPQRILNPGRMYEGL